MTQKENLPEHSKSGSTFLMPKEEMLEIPRKGKKIRIGIPSDKDKVEFRVPLTPQAVELLVSYGHEILLEKKPDWPPAIPMRNTGLPEHR